MLAETTPPGKTEKPAAHEGTTATRTACLIVAFSGADPLTGASRHWLMNLTEVSLGRCKAGKDGRRECDREGTRLRLRFPDVQMSAGHATLRPSRGGWVIEDRETEQPDLPTNGTFVNRQRRSRHRLADGDVIMVGHTVLVFREVAGSRPADELLDVTSTRYLRQVPEGLRTLSPSLEAELGELQKAAKSKLSIVIQGERGTGKELLARLIHERSGRTDPMVAASCAELDDGVIEAELFGYVKGAHSQASEDHDGLITASHRKTMFLDEIGELPLALQAKLLRTLQEGEVRKIGATAPDKLDLRFVFATNCDLPAMVDDDEFRHDLYDRMAGFVMKLPPLRERPEDLGVLLATLFRRHAGETAALSLTAEATAALFAYPWPGNIRELDQTMHRFVALAPAGTALGREHLPMVAAPPADPADVRERLLALLAKHRGNLVKVAAEWTGPDGKVGVSREAIRKRLVALGIDYKTVREDGGEETPPLAGTPDG